MVTVCTALAPTLRATGVVGGELCSGVNGSVTVTGKLPALLPTFSICNCTVSLSSLPR